MIPWWWLPIDIWLGGGAGWTMCALFAAGRRR